jgi:hypothetical protein
MKNTSCQAGGIPGRTSKKLAEDRRGLMTQQGFRKHGGALQIMEEPSFIRRNGEQGNVI